MLVPGITARGDNGSPWRGDQSESPNESIAFVVDLGDEHFFTDNDNDFVFMDSRRSGLNVMRGDNLGEQGDIISIGVHDKARSFSRSEMDRVVSASGFRVFRPDVCAGDVRIPTVRDVRGFFDTPSLIFTVFGEEAALLGDFSALFGRVGDPTTFLPSLAIYYSNADDSVLRW